MMPVSIVRKFTGDRKDLIFIRAARFRLDAGSFFVSMQMS